MPRYDYDCAACGARFEAVHGMAEDGPDTCPVCGAGPVKKAFAAPAIMFKGSGWAKLDRRTAKAPKTAAAETSDAAAPSATGGEVPSPTPPADTSGPQAPVAD